VEAVVTQTTKCRVCNHASREQADALLREGRGQAFVQRFLGFETVDSVHHHVRAGHVAPAPKPTTSAGPTSSGGGWAPTAPGAQPDPIADLTAQRDEIMSVDISTLSPAQAGALRVERRRTSEALARLLPPPPPPPSGAMEKFLSLTFDALDRHPDSWAEVVAGWREYRGLGPEPTTEEIDAARAALNVRNIHSKQEAS
jgi:hypothetical protein